MGILTFREPVDVYLGDIQLHSAIRPLGTSPEISLIGPGALDDWHSLPPSNSEAWEHPSGSGTTPGTHRYGPKRMTIPLVIEGDAYGRDSVIHLREALLRDTWTTLAVQEAGFAWESDVEVVEAAVMREDEETLQVALQLVAHDPLKYGQGSIVLPAGSTALPNCGGEQAFPRIDFSGPGTLTIAHPGGTLSVTTTDSRLRTINGRDGVIYDPPFADGRAGNHWLHPLSAVSGPWPYVLPGGSEWVVSGTSSITVRRWEAWV